MLIRAPFTVDYVHRLRMGSGLLDQADHTLCDILEPTADGVARVAVFVDRGLAEAQPQLTARIEAYFEHHAERLQLLAPPSLIPGGEQAKNQPAVLQDVLTVIHDAGLCRRSYVVVIGGGAVLDVVGFAAAVAHRGVRLVRLPSTTLSQADSGVGVKNGVNAFGKKNYLGCFMPPWAVLSDTQLLDTLPDHDWRGGFSEAVKVAVVQDRDFFDHLDAVAPRLAGRDLPTAAAAIHRSATLHLQHIVGGGDPFELTMARPLDFGHWAAHKLEQLSGFALGHGHAVAIGVALDTVYSARAGHLDPAEADRVCRCLQRLGLPITHPLLHQARPLLDGLQEFREHLGGPLTITLLRGIGAGFDVHHIERRLMCDAIADLASRPTRDDAEPDHAVPLGSTDHE